MQSRDFWNDNIKQYWYFQKYQPNIIFCPYVESQIKAYVCVLASLKNSTATPIEFHLTLDTLPGAFWPPTLLPSSNFSISSSLFVYHDHPVLIGTLRASRNYIRVFKSEKFKSILFVKYANSAFSYLDYNFPLFRNEAKSFLNILSQTQNIVRAIWLHTFLPVAGMELHPKLIKSIPSSRVVSDWELRIFLYTSVCIHRI